MDGRHRSKPTALSSEFDIQSGTPPCQHPTVANPLARSLVPELRDTVAKGPLLLVPEGESSRSSSVSVIENPESPRSSVPPKIGTRFSRQSNRILRQWLDANANYPWPNQEEKETIQRSTGLSIAQISTWFANARRRRKVSSTQTTPIDITPPERSGTPHPIPRARASHQNMDPLQRWFESPPEDEPVSADAIAHAMLLSERTSSGKSLP